MVIEMTSVSSASIFSDFSMVMKHLEGRDRRARVESLGTAFKMAG